MLDIMLHVVGFGFGSYILCNVCVMCTCIMQMLHDNGRPNVTVRHVTTISTTTLRLLAKTQTQLQLKTRSIKD